MSSGSIYVGRVAAPIPPTGFVRRIDLCPFCSYTMCLPSRRLKEIKSPTMNKKQKVPVFDPDSCDFRKLPLQKLEGS